MSNPEIIVIEDQPETVVLEIVEPGPPGTPGSRGDKGDKGDAGDTGPVGPAGVASNSSIKVTQHTTASVWTLVHNMGFNPAGVLVIDTGGNIWEPDTISYPDLNTIRLTFTPPFSGDVYLS